jgi:hypothetical protein
MHFVELVLAEFDMWARSHPGLIMIRIQVLLKMNCSIWIRYLECSGSGSGSLEPYIGVRIRTLLFSSVAFVMPTKNLFFY